MPVSLLLPDENATRALAEKMACALAAALPRAGGMSISLQGDLGAGKTTFVRYLLQALGITGRIKSPSYAIVESYEAAHFSVHHFDFYRLSDAAEWEDAGFRDVFANDGLRLVEWPEKLPAQVVHYDVQMTIAMQSTSDADTAPRQVVLTAQSASAQQWLKALA